MSFILDALRKSENERRLEASPGIMHAPPAVPRERLPLWAVITMSGLTAALLAVMLYSLLDRQTDPAAGGSQHTEPAALAPVVAPEITTDSISSVVPDAPLPDTAPPPNEAGSPRESDVTTAPAAAASQPARTQEASPTPVAATTAVAEPPRESATAPPVETSVDVSAVPTYGALVAEGIGLGILQMQLHVHSSVPASRFVVINGSRFSAGDQLSEGLFLEEIAAEGAVLSFRGRRFLLTPN
jgi:general secretion pathway protein B